MTDSVRPPEFSRAERVRVLVMSASGSVVVSYAAVAALFALVASTATHADFSTAGVLGAAAPGWLTAHHVPLRFSGGQLAVLPLLPTFLLVLLIARTAASTADRLGLYEPLQARAVVLSISGAHAAVGGGIALLLSDGPVLATPAVAFFGCAAVSGVAATLGVARRCGLVEVVLERLDPVALRGVRAGLIALFALVAAGAAVFAASLAASFSTAAVLFDQTGTTVGVQLGMWLLCLGYLPNAIVGGLSFVAGAGFSLGEVTISPTRFTGGDLPAVPLLAALPERQIAFLPAVLVLPLLIGCAVGWYCRRVAPRPGSRVRAVLVAAVTAGAGGLVLAAVAGGRLGLGSFDPVTVPAGLLAVLVAVWIVLPGALVTWFAGPRPERLKRTRVRRARTVTPPAAAAPVHADAADDPEDPDSEDDAEEFADDEPDSAEDDVDFADGAEDDGAEDDGAEDDGAEDEDVEDDGVEDDGVEDDGAEDDGAEDDGEEPVDEDVAAEFDDEFDELAVDELDDDALIGLGIDDALDGDDAEDLDDEDLDEDEPGSETDLKRGR
ncbi:cell division protein PerM [Umezawaea beigongshangensis]|uniref:cell division protein PerM n=1 Tax=Umezawaea beigongshangensis TaxID=2780383 RepID=UPI0018F16C43|nr:DUF6350 family protein [Umezawaea beigongshangensis]